MSKLRFEFSAAHMNDDLRPEHGPQVWPWWRLMSFGWVRFGSPTFTGRRLWAYTRWGAMFATVYLDRRQ